jgi:hypothetical protein
MQHGGDTSHHANEREERYLSRERIRATRASRMSYENPEVTMEAVLAHLHALEVSRISDQQLPS